MLVVNIEVGYKLVGINVCTRDNIAKATFEQYENGQCVNRNVVFDAPVDAVEEAMNAAPNGQMPSRYVDIGTIVFGLAMASGRIGGRIINPNAADPVAEVVETPVDPVIADPVQADPVQNTEDADPPPAEDVPVTPQP